MVVLEIDAECFEVDADEPLRCFDGLDVDGTFEVEVELLEAFLAWDEDEVESLRGLGIVVICRKVTA